jgi:hypothetical protein
MVPGRSFVSVIESHVARPLQLLAAGAALALFVEVMVGPYTYPSVDLAPVVVAGHLVADGQTAYLYSQDQVRFNRVGDATFRQVARTAGFVSEPTPFVYPPLVAYAMKTMTDVPFSRIARFWAYASAIMILAALYGVFAAYLPAWNRPLGWAAVLLLLCLFEPLRYGFWLGQTTALIFPLVVAAVALQRHERPIAAGLALAVAAFIKLTPIVVVATWLWRGPRRPAAWFAIFLALLWTASLATMGVASNVQYLTRLAAISRIDLVAFNNQSILATLSRPWFHPSMWIYWHMYDPPVVPLVATRAILVMASLSAAYCLFRIPAAPDHRWRNPAEGMAFLLMLFAPNIAWTHYYVFLLPVMAIVLAEQRAGSVAPAAMVAIAFALCCRPILSPQDQPPTTTSALLVAIPILAALVLAIALFGTAYVNARRPQLAIE